MAHGMGDCLVDLTEIDVGLLHLGFEKLEKKLVAAVKLTKEK